MAVSDRDPPADAGHEPATVAGCPGRTLWASVGEAGLALEFGHEIALRVDPEGRWASLRVRDAFWRRLVDAGVVCQHGTHKVPEEVASPDDVHERAREIAAAVAAILRRGAVPVELAPGTTADGVLALLDATAPWTRERFAEDRRRFAAAYAEPPLILPPDRYRDVIVHPAVGCPSRGCKFCAFYLNRPFRLLDDAEFAAHLGALQALFGRALPARRGVFLGSANALALPQERLLRAMAGTRAAIGPLPRGFAAFWDPDHAPARHAADWEALRSAGLRRVIAGLETGDPRLRQELGKSPRIDRFVAAVQQERGSGIPLAITLLVGAGDEADTPRHEAATVAAIGRCGLASEDIVYLSPLEGSRPPARLHEETSRLHDALRAATAAKVVPYRIERFRYYA